MLFRVPDRFVAAIATSAIAEELPKNTRPLQLGVINPITTLECLSVPMSDRGVLVMAVRGRETTGIALWVNSEATLTHLERYVRKQIKDQAATVCCVSLFLGVALEPGHALTSIPNQAAYYSTPFFAEVISVLHKVRNAINFSQQREFYGYDPEQENAHLLLTTEGALLPSEAPGLTLPAMGQLAAESAHNHVTHQANAEGGAEHSFLPAIKRFPPPLSLQLPDMNVTAVNMQALQNAPVQTMRKKIVPNAGLSVTTTSTQRPLKLPPLTNNGLLSNIRRARLTSIAEHDF